MASSDQNIKCSRCKGTGRYTARGHLANDVCFGCSGKGYRTPEDRAASRSSREQALSRTAAVRVIESFARTVSDAGVRNNVLCATELEDVVIAVRNGDPTDPVAVYILDYLVGRGYDFVAFVNAR